MWHGYGSSEFTPFALVLLLHSDLVYDERANYRCLVLAIETHSPEAISITPCNTESLCRTCVVFVFCLRLRLVPCMAETGISSGSR